MTRPTIRIHNTITDEVIDREMNDAEFEQFEADKAASDALVAAAAQTATDKAALLAKLGISDDEAKLLLS